MTSTSGLVPARTATRRKLRFAARVSGLASGLALAVRPAGSAKVTRDALRRLSDWLDHDEDQGDEASR